MASQHQRLTVLLCGPVPAPVGGVSIHIQRLASRLQQRGYCALLCDESPTAKPGVFFLRSLRVGDYLRLIHQADLVHVHSSIHLFRLLHLLSAWLLRRPIVVTLHSWRSGRITTRFWQRLFRLTGARMIYVNPIISAAFDDRGLVCPAYIDADLQQEPALPVEIGDWIEQQKGRGNRLVVANAYRLTDHDGVDLYGLDLCIEALRILRGEKLTVALLFVVANPGGGTGKLFRFNKLLAEYGLQDYCLIHPGSLSFVRLLRVADVSVRATNTDGDALSVRESLASDCITIASDAVARPPGTRLFATRNARELAKVIEAGLAAASTPDGDQEAIKSDCVEQIDELYRRAIYQ